MPLTSGSQLDRLLECPGSVVLPREESKAGEAAAWGTSCHYWAESGQIVASPEYPKHQRFLEAKLNQYNRDIIWPSSGKVYKELGFAWHKGGKVEILADRTRGELDEWKNSKDSEWIVGTADYVAVTEDTLWVDDLKTGRQLWGHTVQISWYLWAMYAYLGRPDLNKRGTITHLPRYPIASNPTRHEVKLLPEAELHSFVQGLHSTTAENVKLKTGPQCRFCPSRNSCPELISLRSRAGCDSQDKPMEDV